MNHRLGRSIGKLTSMQLAPAWVADCPDLIGCPASRDTPATLLLCPVNQRKPAVDTDFTRFKGIFGAIPSFY